MDNLPAWVAKWITIWTTIGALLVMFGTKIMDIPDWMPALFSDATVRVILTVVGSAISAFQYFRTDVFKKVSTEVTNVVDGVAVKSAAKVMSLKQKRSFARNPFSLAA